MMKTYSSLIKPRTLSEQRAAYLFHQFCFYNHSVNGEIINLNRTGLASLYYHHLVHWFNTVGRTFFPEINNYDSAEFTLYVNTGISSPDDLIKIFSPENISLIFREDETPAFCVTPEVSEEIPVMSVITEPTEPAVPETTQTDDTEITEDDSDVKIGRKKHEIKASCKGRTHVCHQHHGIEVARPIKEYSVKVSGKTEYFVLHAGPGTEILCYSTEPGKTIRDYMQKSGLTGSWKHPYLLAIRHDYVQRTGNNILNVRKVAYPNWVRTWRAKYLKETRLFKKELKEQKKK